MVLMIQHVLKRRLIGLQALDGGLQAGHALQRRLGQ